MSVQQLTNDAFETEVLASDVPVLVDFWSPSCGPCRMMEPVIDELAKESEGRYHVKKVNVWDEPELATRFQISAVPTLLVFKQGEVVWSALGVQDKRKLSRALQEAA
ncbi:MAG TPA: thioredoxin [Pirellulales bacterium]|jgi:thioredoxin 1|nr:thioredoxin [Pirellulales bacterium]